MTPELLTLLTTLVSYLTGRALLWLARRLRWTTAQKKLIPAAALVVGAAFHGGGTAWMAAGSATLRELLSSVLMGAFAGAGAVAVREITKAGTKPEVVDATSAP